MMCSVEVTMLQDCTLSWKLGPVPSQDTGHSRVTKGQSEKSIRWKRDRFTRKEGACVCSMRVGVGGVGQGPCRSGRNMLSMVKTEGSGEGSQQGTLMIMSLIICAPGEGRGEG